MVDKRACAVKVTVELHGEGGEAYNYLYTNSVCILRMV